MLSHFWLHEIFIYTEISSRNIMYAKLPQHEISNGLCTHHTTYFARKYHSTKTDKFHKIL